MLMQEERELVVEYGKKMSAARLSTGTSGNISIYNAEKGLVALSPSGMDYFSTTPEDVVILDLDGKVVDNSSVAANAAQSMTGTLNLQFSSDAILKPAEITSLRQGQKTNTGADGN